MYGYVLRFFDSCFAVIVIIAFMVCIGCELLAEYFIAFGSYVFNVLGHRQWRFLAGVFRVLV